ncbi:MAG: twin-arginine translocation signal domain-containing protein, partial [Marivivens sp.]|nr:twin-arginine translocation signal domain-containing protein [Marivivens sp.]
MSQIETFYEVMRKQGITRRSFMKYCSLTASALGLGPSFVPQIALLFLLIAVLEGCGYLSRAAFLMDRLLVGVGLSGKSFIPLLSSFACAIPGIMAARTIENRRDRLLT